MIVKNVLIEADQVPPGFDPREFIVDIGNQGELGHALRQFGLRPNAGPKDATEAYTLDFNFKSAVSYVFYASNATVVRKHIDRGTMYVSRWDTNGNLRIRVLLGWVNPQDQKPYNFSRMKWQYYAYYRDHNDQFKGALAVIAKQFGSVYKSLTERTFTSKQQLIKTMTSRGFKPYKTIRK